MAKKNKLNRNKRQNRVDENFKAKDVNVEFAREIAGSKQKNIRNEKSRKQNDGGGC